MDEISADTVPLPTYDILRKKVRDPRVQDVNITDVHVTGDLQQATIYYSLRAIFN
jgi:ribosome-binding factor A